MIALFLSFAFACPPQDPAPTDFAAKLTEARTLAEQGDYERCLALIENVLERDSRNLEATRLLAEVSEKHGDIDRTVHSWHRWIELLDARGKPSRDAERERKATFEHLLELDSEARAWSKLQAGYIDSLRRLAKDYRKRKDWLGALGVLTQLLQFAPDDREGKAGMLEVRRKGGKDVAVEDVFAGGGDPTAGKSGAAIARQDAEHSTWETAYTDKTDNYRYRTDAGFLVLQTSMIAMEQMNKFYRKFFRYKEDGGKTPAIEIRIFKNRDEYLELGQNPAEWSGGQFTGNAVETYVGGASGKESIREMYGTLFHEAAHQFVRLTCPRVPGWLNEAFASFFEGTVILSNGSVRWNQPPPHRLFPLCRRMETGWMKSPDEAGTDSEGNFRSPESAPDFRMIVENRYRWGPPWYAPTWGLVYFLYNFRSEDGRPVYRDQLLEYYWSFKGKHPDDPIAHFEEMVLKASKLSPVQSIDELTPIWKDWILTLRDKETGKIEGGAELLRFADAAIERGDLQMALEFYEEARLSMPDDPELLWGMASLLERLKQDSRAAARYREFRRALEQTEATGDERYAEADKKITRLDPLVTRYTRMKAKLGTDGIALAKSYEERELPLMALEIVRRMSASFSIPSAIDYYVELARRTGKSLARWSVAYNEHNLDGWSGDTESYQAYGQTIRASVAKGGTASGGIVTSQLACDVTFDGDFSLSAEMQVPSAPDGAPLGELVGLCFGRKGDQNFNAVFLHPKGFMDISTNRGGEWTIHDHRSVPVGSGEWHTLRIDVYGATLDVYYDDRYVRSFEFKSKAATRGGFGLITGVGDALYRNVRLLARDPHDPTGLVERKIAMEKVAADASLRQEGSFTGFAPPELGDRCDWVQGTGSDLAGMLGKPAMIVFWSPAQDAVIPCTTYLQHLIDKGTAQGLVSLVIADGNTTRAALEAYLAEHPIRGASVGHDARFKVYNDYYVKPGFFGLPRVILVDREGKVVFEGDPGLSRGAGWKPGDPATYVDGPFEKLIG